MPSSVSPATTNAGPTFSYPHAADHPGWLVIGQSADQSGWLVIGHPAAGHPGWLVIGHPAAGHPGWLVIGHPAAGQRGRPPWQATLAGHPQGVALLYTGYAGATQCSRTTNVYSRATPCGWPARVACRRVANDQPARLVCRLACRAGLPRWPADWLAAAGLAAGWPADWLAAAGPGGAGRLTWCDPGKLARADWHGWPTHLRE
jgi:hypothetical protein